MRNLKRRTIRLLKSTIEIRGLIEKKFDVSPSMTKNTSRIKMFDVFTLVRESPSDIEVPTKVKRQHLFDLDYVLANKIFLSRKKASYIR